MRFGDIKLAAVIVSILIYSGSVVAANSSPRTCPSNHSILHQETLPAGGSGGTGHEVAPPPGGIGGTGNTTLPSGVNENDIEAAADVGGIGGTGNAPIIPPGGIGGTGITMAGTLTKASGNITVLSETTQQIVLTDGDAICTGDRIIAGSNSQAKITFSDGATLHILQSSEISIDDYQYFSVSPSQSHSTVSLIKGDIRSISGAISKINPAQYAIKTPVATIRVIGTDFLVTHLPENSNGLLMGTYTKVISGEVSVASEFGKVLLRAGESSHVLLNGIQSIIKSSGGTCSFP